MSVAHPVGWLLAGRYRLLAELGRGGMGKVWRAHDELLDRQVAIKEVTLSQRPGPEREVLLGRTMREARLAARLSHPHIAAVYDVVVADERPWIVLQLVSARSLAEVITEQGPLPVPTVAHIGLQVLDALHTAHADGIVHRDVKPGNILLTGDQRRHAVLTDFGLATTLDDQAHLTQAGIVVGTPAYIAPERARGGPATPEADLWSLGATLYAAVEGHAPFPHSSELATLSAVLTASPDPFRQAGPLGPVITGLLDKDPARRTGADDARRQLTRVAALHEQGIRDTAAVVIGPTSEAAAVNHPPVNHPPATGGRPPREDGAPVRAAGRRVVVPVRWRQAAALTALIVSVLATTSWPGSDPAGSRSTQRAEPATHPAGEPTGIMSAYPVTDERITESRRRHTSATGTAQPPAAGSDQTALPPGQAKKVKTKKVKTKQDKKWLATGKGQGRGHR
jgi:hypothetical protein